MGYKLLGGSKMLMLKEIILSILNLVIPAFLAKRCSNHLWLTQHDIVLDNGLKVNVKTCINCNKRKVES
jgi:hypothetical protein